MSTDTLPGPLGEFRAASTAGGGTSLSTTAVVIPLWPGTKEVMVTPRNLSTAVVAKVSTNPWATVLKTTDLLVANLTDESATLQDNTTSTVTIGALPTSANGGYLYLGVPRPISGVKVDVGTANTVSSTLTAKYWSGAAWSALSLTDGTISSAKTLATDGSITWTTPTDWATVSLFGAGDTANDWGIARHPLYWVRFEVSAALSSGTAVVSMYAIASDTHYAEVLPSLSPFTFGCNVGPGGIASLNALTDAGTGNLVVNCATGGKF